MMSEYESTPILTNCVFNKNSAVYGGGICNEGSSPTLTNCRFSSNSAGVGGGMYNGVDPMLRSQSSLILNNCTFTNNLAVSSGMQQGWGGTFAQLAEYLAKAL